jgi:hypothetical protein
MGKLYDEVRAQADKPIRSRRAMKIGRAGALVKPRKFHLNTAQIDQLRAEYKETGSIPNPFNKGAYHYTVAALIALGVDSKHKLATVQDKVKELMSDPETKQDGKTAWQRFRDKDARGSEETSLDWQGRFEQNIRVLQRFGGVTPYGLKLNEVGQKVCRFKGLVIDLLKSANGAEVYVSLNTKANRPTNELKTRNVAPVKPAKRRPKRKAARKAAPAVAEAPASQEAETAGASA